MTSRHLPANWSEAVEFLAGGDAPANGRVEPTQKAEGSRIRDTFATLDSGERVDFPSGMRRDTDAGKPRFDLLVPLGVQHDDQFLTRVAQLMARGSAKYGDRNWENAESPEELERFRASAFRHLMQWMAGDRSEDHAAAVVFNLLAAETLRLRLDV